MRSSNMADDKSWYINSAKVRKVNEVPPIPAQRAAGFSLTRETSFAGKDRGSGEGTSFRPAHVGPERFRNGHAAVVILVILQNGNHGAAYGKPRTVQRMHIARALCRPPA